MRHIQMAVDCVLHVLEVLEATRSVLHCTSEALEGVRCVLEVPEVMRFMLFCMLEAVEVVPRVL